MVKAFQLAKTPQVIFGNGKISVLAGIAKEYGNDILLVTGANSFIHSTHAEFLFNTFELTGIQFHRVTINTEPTPEMIDQAVVRNANNNIKLVIAIGGGSVIDAGKAISAMLTKSDSINNYIEGIGNKEHDGSKIPFIAVPTTSGTGSEATNNSVISQVGAFGFKRSLRHDNFVPDIAIIDPELTLSCSVETTVASGMDCFTQLVEAYLSTKAIPYTDVLALDAIKMLVHALPRVHKWGADLEARTAMSYAAYISGICLVNAGLGVVHGFASSVGGFHNIPHGVLCGTLIAPANAITVKKLRENEAKNTVALKKYAELGKLFSNDTTLSDNILIVLFIQKLYEFTDNLKIARLSKFNIAEKDFEKIAENTSCKNNPVKLSKSDLIDILKERL